MVALDEGGATENFSAFGGTLALLAGQEAETGLTISRYADLSRSSCQRSMTFFGLDSFYYPVGAGGLAPFASTQLGLARVTDEDPDLLFGACLPAEPTTELGLGFGLGLRVNMGGELAAMIEGRFFQVPNSAIQALEARANVSVLFGSRRAGTLGAGTVGPAVSMWIPISGPLRGRAPFFGVRFRRDTRDAGTLALQIDYASLEITEDCSQECEPFAILFAPAYERSLHPSWGRFYGGLGVLIAGFPAVGPDRGMTQGAHGGLGVDVFAGEHLMINLNARVVWLQRTGGSGGGGGGGGLFGSGAEHVFGVQLGGSVSPKVLRSSVRRGRQLPDG
jgi:hypothetical protein